MNVVTSCEYDRNERDTLQGIGGFCRIAIRDGYSYPENSSRLVETAVL